MSATRRAARRNELANTKKQILLNQLKIEEEIEEQLKKNGQWLGESIREHEEKLARIKDELALLEAQERVTKGAAEATADMTSAFMAMAGISGEMNLTAKFSAFMAEAGDLKTAFGELLDEMNRSIDAGMVLQAAGSKMSQGIMGIGAMMIEQAMALDTTEASIRRTMGVNKEYASSVRDVYQANKINGVTAQEAGASFEALHSDMAVFSQLNKAQRTQITETAAQLSKLGVSNASFAGGMDMSTKALRMTADEARRTQTDLARFSGELGIAPEVMAQGFANAGPVLAKFGDNATVAFKNVAKTAKETGIEIDRILDYTKQFDTFEGAAERVGSLNAMLGGYFINAMDLMATEDPAERMKMITDAVHSAGKSFEEMGYYEKLALAEAGGFADVAELSRAMSGDMSDNATSTKENAMSQEELAEMNRTNMDLMQKMQATMAELAPSIMGIIDSLNTLMIPIMAFVDTFGFLVLPLLIAARIYFFALQMQHMANVRANTAMELAERRAAAAKAASNAATQAQSASEAANTAAKGANTTAVGANSAAEQANTAATSANTVAEGANTGAVGVNTAAEAANTAATGANTVAEGANTAAAGANTAAQNLNNIALIKGKIATVASTVARGANSAATFIAATATGAYNVALGIGKVVSWAMTAATTAFGISLTAATGGLILVVPLIIGLVAGAVALVKKFGLAKVIMYGFGAALLYALGPIGLVIGAVIMIVKYWDEIKAALSKVGDKIKAIGKMIYDATAGVMIAAKEKIVGVLVSIKDFFVQNWERIKAVSIAALQIIARVIAAVMTGGWSLAFEFVYRKWDTLKGYVTGWFTWMKNKLTGVGAAIARVMGNIVKSPFRIVAKVINAALAGIEKVLTIRIRVPKILPGPSKWSIGPPNLGRIPMLAMGTENFEGGQAIVGEQGPELVNMPKGAQVEPANKTKAMAETLKMVASTTKKIAGALSIVGVPGAGAAEKALGAVAGKGQSGQPVTINVTLELDKRVLANHVEEVMLDKLNPANA